MHPAKIQEMDGWTSDVRSMTTFVAFVGQSVDTSILALGNDPRILGHPLFLKTRSNDSGQTGFKHVQPLRNIHI
jgi:hypothetical protein